MTFISTLLSDSSKDAAGNNIQYTAKKTMNANNPMTLVAPYSKTWINAELDASITKFFDGAGGRNSLTWADMVANYNDIYFYESPSKFVVNSQPLTGDCLNKTLKYVGQ